MRSILLDFSAALRFFARRRAAPAVIVLTMSLAIAANTAVFSVLRSFLFSSLAIPDAGRVVYVWTVRELEGRGAVNFFDAYVNIEQMRRTTHFAESMGAAIGVDFNWERDGAPTSRLEGARVQAEFFKVMRVQPVIGRVFTAAEEGPHAAPVVLIATSLWRSAFNASPDVVGQTIRLNGVPHTIIGVLPEGFAQPQPSVVWLPFDVPEHVWTNVIGARQLSNFARLAPGVSESMARDELRAFAPLAIEAHPDNKDWTWTVQSLREALLNGADRTILLVQIGAGILLLLAISNLASLLLAWAAERERETALRHVLGASTWRLVRQFLVQGMLLAFAGGILGIVLADFSLPLMQRLNPDSSLAPFVSRLDMDTGTLLFATALMLGVGLLAGILPALGTRRSGFAESIQSQTRGASAGRAALRWQKAMIVVQGAVSVLILVGAGLAALGFARVNKVRLGFQSADRVAFRVHFPDPTYSSHEKRAQFVRELEANLAREPAIDQFGFSATLPVGDIQWGGGFLVQRPGGDIDPEPAIFHYRRVSPGYLKVMGMPLLEGRLLTDQDTFDAPTVAVISEAAAKRYWPGESPIGHTLIRMTDRDAPPFRIVGVVGDVRDAGPASPPGVTIYVPWQQVSLQRGWVVLEGRNTSEILAAGRRALAATSPGIASFGEATMDDLVWRSNSLPRLQIALLGIFGLIAICITALGSYGVMSQLVSNRQREMAIRSALGATKVEVLRLVLLQNARLAVSGIVLGIAAAWLSARWAQSALTAFPADVVWPYAAVAAVVIVLTQVASYVPARRAAAQDVPKALAAT